MSIRDSIQSCKNCPLNKNMTVSPIATEIFGKKPLVLFVSSSKPNKSNDLSQEVLRISNRMILSNICASIKIDYATTFLVKCTKDTAYTASEIKICARHIGNECSALKIKSVICLGKKSALIRPHLPEGVTIYTMDAPDIVFNNTSKLQLLAQHLMEIKNDFS